MAFMKGSFLEGKAWNGRAPDEAVFQFCCLVTAFEVYSLDIEMLPLP